MENIVFDLGGVLFARDRSKCTQEFHDFFSFIRSEPMPAFWEDYDRGVLTLDEVTGILSGVNACPRAKCEEYLRHSPVHRDASHDGSFSVLVHSALF